MRLNVLHRGRVKYGDSEKKKPKRGILDVRAVPIDLVKALSSKDYGSQMSMHEVPHLDGTHGNVPRPGKPKWLQSPLT